MKHPVKTLMKKRWHLCVAIIVAAVFPAFGTAMAGGYSDHAARQSSANRSANSTLKYGGTYSQAGRNYINNRDNWSTPAAPGQASQGKPMTEEEKAEYQRLMQKTDNMLNSIYNTPHHFGPQPRQMTADEKANMEQTLQQSNDLIDQIENDPLLK
ncbi:MAG: hypothetical protein SWH61_06760 [Thermodesulfobacteriota bacterium]|nr:hypothetical protein [Thermodesulfobacteriota bacterium]